MKTIKTFRHEQFGEIRICMADDKELFCLSDVCKALAIGNPSDLKRRLSGRGVVTIETPIKNQYGTVVAQKLSYVDEPNLYRCIFQSRKAEAEQFQDWVFEEVLPQIRQTGGYIPVSSADDEKTILCKAIDIMNRMIEQLRPKAEYAEKVLLSPSCYTMTQVAKGLSMTVLELTRRLHELGVIYRSPSGPLMLYAPYLKNGFEAYRTAHGEDIFGNVTWSSSYLVWTEKGKEFITKKIRTA